MSFHKEMMPSHTYLGWFSNVSRKTENIVKRLCVLNPPKQPFLRCGSFKPSCYTIESKKSGYSLCELL